MPVVMDAFKNLIRHGKQGKGDHHVAQAQHQPHREHRAREPQPAQTHQQPMASPRYEKEAQLIVQDERQAKSKMPSYKGLEKFQLLTKMGDGAFSNVYNALDTVQNRKVAVKVVRKFELNASQRANILKEVQIMRGTNHPSIVKLYSFSESDEHYFLVMELMEGGELFHQIVKLTYFSENLSRHVILQVAQGIRYLHEERGVVHRDIKPENLLFERIPIIPSATPVNRPYDEEKEDEGEFIPGVGGGGIGRVKIADFGLSKVVWNEQTMTPCGTVGYTAPEIVKDERYSKSVDMWALGCVLYTLLCGFPPFYDESINVLTEKVARGYYTFLSPWWDDINASSKDLITHLLCVDPAQRFTIDEFLAHPWCNAAPAPPPPPTPLPKGVDSPLLHSVRGGREIRSPGIATLKEAFDITYAVHRMEEEGAHRRGRGFLQGLEEEDDEDEEMVEDTRRKHGEQAGKAVDQQQIRSKQTQRNRAGNRSDADRAPLNDGRAGLRDRGHRQRNGAGGFALDLDAATLLGRRHRRNNVGETPISLGPESPQEQDVVDAPQSPMHY